MPHCAVIRAELLRREARASAIRRIVRIIIYSAFFAWCASLVWQPAAAQSASADKTHAAYELAIKCFVVNGYASDVLLKKSDLEGSSRFEGNTKRAWDIADSLRVKLGYSKERYQADHKRIIWIGNCRACIESLAIMPR